MIMTVNLHTIRPKGLGGAGPQPQGRGQQDLAIRQFQPQGAKAADETHNLVLPGSIPGPATTPFPYHWIQEARAEIRAAWDTEFRRRPNTTAEDLTPVPPPTPQEVRVLCGWCGTHLRGSTDPRAIISHGICPQCATEFLADLPPKEAA